MSGTKKPLPSYRLHKQSGQGIVTLTDVGGQRRDVLLGKFGTSESLAESAASGGCSSGPRKTSWCPPRSTTS